MSMKEDVLASQDRADSHGLSEEGYYIFKEIKLMIIASENLLKKELKEIKIELDVLSKKAENEFLSDSIRGLDKKIEELERQDDIVISHAQAVRDALKALALKLDADATVTDEDYSDSTIASLGTYN